MRSLTLQGLVSGLSKGKGRKPAPRDPRRELERAGIANIGGFPLRREVFDEVASIDLARTLQRFNGRCLLLQVSRTSETKKDYIRLAEHLRSLGADVRVEVIVDTDALKFGLPRFRTHGFSAKLDTQAALTESILSLTAAWCDETGNVARAARSGEGEG